MSTDSIFHPGHKATRINYLIPQSKSARLEWSGFAGCFPTPSGNLYMRYGALMELWSAWVWLYVAVQLCGVE